MSEDFRVSVSKTKTFSQCKKQYQYNYILRLPKKTREYHVTGKFCHRVLEVFHNYYIEGCLLPYNISMADAFKTAWIEFKEQMTPEMKKECWDIINSYLKKISGKMLMNVLACEKKFALPIGKNIILNGAIDIVRVGDDDVLEVADWKTTKNKKYLREDWLQLMTYGFVLLKENPELKKIRGSYILLRHDFEPISRDFSADELLAVEQQYIDYAEQMINEKDFEATTSALCFYCDFLEHCPEGKEKVNSNPTQSHKVYGEVSW